MSCSLVYTVQQLNDGMARSFQLKKESSLRD